jgi:XTP/dITP diphosphohydrolase
MSFRLNQRPYMLKLIFASSNAHKAEEMALLFRGTQIEISPPPEGLKIPETGSSFWQNAGLKAQSYFEKFASPCVSDDSGLIIPARSELLGVQTADYRNDLPNYHERCLSILEELKELKEEERVAYFVCVLCFHLSAQEIFFFEGRVSGLMAQKYQPGESGFGYDPIFLPEEGKGKSLSELGDWKNLHSHRAKASQAAKAFFQARLEWQK